MRLIDTHSHIYSSEFNGDIQDVINRAQEAKVEKILLPNIDSESIPKMMELTETFPGICYPMMGLHPTSVKENYEEELNLVEEWLKKGTFLAVGEVGIDLYWDKTFQKEQEIAFDRQIQWAQSYDLPLVIHSRESFDEIFSILEPYKKNQLQGIFHSFTGTIEQAQKAISMGFLLGVNGILTFKNAGLDKVFNQIDLKHLVLETDAPYLAPVPKRGKRNESSYVQYTAEKLAEIHNTTLEKVAEITTTNAQNIFRF
ncbi:MAG: TatD family hydrolase [Marinifilaceae bacterium]